MAARNLLHRSKLDDFKYWLSKNGFSIINTNVAFEVLRWKNCRDDNYKGTMPIIFDGKSKQHYSCNEASIPYIKRFIKESKETQPWN